MNKKNHVEFYCVNLKNIDYKFPKYKNQHKIMSNENVFLSKVYYSTQDRILKAISEGRNLFRNIFSSSDMIAVI